MRGYRLSLDTRKKMSLSKTGSRHSEETKRKIGLKSKGRSSPLKGLTKESHPSLARRSRLLTGRRHSKDRIAAIANSNRGRKRSPEACARIREGTLAAIARNSGKETVPEKATRLYLIGLGVEFQQYKRLGYFVVDFYVPNFNLVIEVQGCWWHNCDWCHPGKIDVRSSKSKDLARVKTLESLGYKVVQLWEHDIKVNNFSVLTNSFQIGDKKWTD